jgi:hypothetical protein
LHEAAATGRQESSTAVYRGGVSWKAKEPSSNGEGTDTQLPQEPSSIGLFAEFINHVLERHSCHLLNFV